MRASPPLRINNLPHALEAKFGEWSVSVRSHRYVVRGFRKSGGEWRYGIVHKKSGSVEQPFLLWQTACRTAAKWERERREPYNQCQDGTWTFLGWRFCRHRAIVQRTTRMGERWFCAAHDPVAGGERIREQERVNRLKKWLGVEEKT
jgi:hypothetical protein